MEPDAQPPPPAAAPAEPARAGAATAPDDPDITSLDAAADPAPAGAASASGTPGSGATGAPAARPTLGKREGRSPRDMALSLAVLLIPIALLLTFYRVVLSGDAPVTVDPAPTIQEARSAAVFPVLVPTGLSDDWHVSSATYRTAPEGATLRLGYVAPDDDSALLVESSVPPEQLLPAELGESAEPRGTYRDGGRPWRAYEARRGETALVLAQQGRTVVVVGTTDEENLRTLARSLA